VNVTHLPCRYFVGAMYVLIASDIRAWYNMGLIILKWNKGQAKIII
jgi:hypothetical protein